MNEYKFDQSLDAERKDYRSLQRLSFATTIISILIITLSFGYLVQKYLDIESTWNQKITLIEKQTSYINNLSNLIGYGGYIHNFKNAVLRKDFAYFKKLEEQESQAIETLNKLEDLFSEQEEKQYLQAITLTLLEYSNKHQILLKAITENWTPEEIDKQVKVNDTNAIQAIQNLRKINQEQTLDNAHAYQAQLDELEKSIAAFFFVILGLALFSAYTHAQARKLQQNISEISSQLTELQNFFASAVESINDSIIITNSKGIIEYSNKKSLEVFGYEKNELEGQEVTVLIPAGKHKKNHATYMQSSGLKTKVLNQGRTLEAIKKDGKTFPVEITISPFKTISGTKFVGVINDVSEKIKLMKKLADTIELHKQNSMQDYLTNLLNRKGFFEELRKLKNRLKRNQSYSAIIMIDLDNFKKVNDNFGHKAGDTVLKQTSSLLKEQCREIDVLARWGGEEFIIAIAINDAKDAEEFAERIRSKSEQTVIDIGVSKIFQKLSIGVKIIEPDDSDSIQDAILEADKALYKAKHSGKNKVVVC